jgi:hypothetical protein
MESTMNKTMQAESKRAYMAPRVEQVKLDTEISLVMTSGPVGDPEMPQNPNNNPMPQFVQKIFKLF